MDIMPNDNPPLNSGEEWPYGYGMCCCGCGKKARVLNGVLHKFYQGYHENWLKNESGGNMIGLMAMECAVAAQERRREW